MARLLTDLMNHLLRFDPKTTYYASALIDCCLQISLKMSSDNQTLQDKCYFITFNAQGLRAIEPLSDTFSRMRRRGVDSRDGESSNTGMYAPESHSGKGIGAHISATPATFLGLLLHKNSRRAMEQGLIFEGEPNALALLEQWLGDCQIDWAEIIATYLGDTTAHSIEKTLHRLIPKSRQRFDDLCAHMGEYAVEQNLSPPRPLVNHFLQAVDALRAGVERLEAKLP